MSPFNKFQCPTSFGFGTTTFFLFFFGLYLWVNFVLELHLIQRSFMLMHYVQFRYTFTHTVLSNLKKVQLRNMYCLPHGLGSMIYEKQFGTECLDCLAWGPRVNRNFSKKCVFQPLRHSYKHIYTNLGSFFRAL